MSNFDRVKVAIDTSPLQPQDKFDLIAIFAEISEPNLAHPAALFEKDPGILTTLNENRKKKQECFATNNHDLWATILDEEEKHLKSLTYDLD